MGLSASEWIAVIGLIIVNGGVILTFFINMSVKIAEINQRYISLQNEVTDHKNENKDTFNEMKEFFKDYKNDNKEEHKDISDKLDVFSTQLTNATRTIITNSGK